MNGLEVVELTKVFRGPQAEIRAVDHVSFTVKIGETLGLIGESGCGKSTLAYCIARLIQPTSGSVFLDRKDWLQVEGAPLRRLRQRIQLVFQDPYTSLNPRMKIGNILEEPLVVHKIGSGEERRIRVQEMLSNVGLEPHHIHRKADEFSGGQRQRIAIARALMTQPALLIADEPLSSLDSTTQSRILDLLARLKEKYSLSMLFISHNLEAVHQISDRIAIMHCGKLVEIASREAIFETARHPYTRFLLESAAVRDADRLPEGVPSYEPCDLREISPDHWAAV